MKKKVFNLIILLLMGIILIGCENEKNDINKDFKTSIYSFEDNGKEFVLGDIFTTEKYGSPINYSEVASCAFDGLDKTYTYNHYEVTTYPDGENDYIYSVYFLDESINTKEGIKISDTYNDMIKTYGKKYEKTDNQYKYKLNNTSINFIVENDIITSIEYVYLTN